jgi:hypothetical protein
METRVLVSTTRILTDCHKFLKGSMETAECGEKFHEALELMLQYEGSYLTLTHPVTNPKSLWAWAELKFTTAAAKCTWTGKPMNYCTGN